MQNQCSCGQSGFIPASGSWDFSACGQCQPRSRRNRASEEECAAPRSLNKCHAPQDNECPRERSGQNGCPHQQKAEDPAAGCSNRADACAPKRNACSSSAMTGMISIEQQKIDEIFEAGLALRAGTLFPELHKPLNGYCPPRENCGTRKQAAAFAAWELRLYLNTHPRDKEALALFRKLCSEAGEESYAGSFLPDECLTDSWNWVQNPWPWEFDCHCGN